jgi:hypothetical protein
MKAFMIQHGNQVSCYEVNILSSRKKSLTIEYILWKLYLPEREQDTIL